jgi:hypothetical protein
MIVVPFPAGGPLDFTARLLAEKLSSSLRQPFTIENRAGVAGNIGTEVVAKAPPDGHTLLMVLDTPLTPHGRIPGLDSNAVVLGSEAAGRCLRPKGLDNKTRHVLCAWRVDIDNRRNGIDRLPASGCAINSHEIDPGRSTRTTT